ncbi:hypothetical protein HYY74_03400 [Candidatus Woesearchaeota archaeon]|nr:hypothetical protein [Candidatus Woesearchaeota archaeon]
MNAPMFVKIDRYKKVSFIMDRLHKRLGDAKVVLRRISELKRAEDEEIISWQNEISKIESKVAFIEDALARTKEQ